MDNAGLRAAAVVALHLALTAGAAAETAILATVPAGECNLTVEADVEWHSLRLRAQHPAYRRCSIDAAAAAAALEAADLPADLASVSLGRLEDYPWLSRHLADAARADAGWNGRTGRPRRGHENAYVGRTLFEPKLLAPLAAALERHGYHIRGVSVEKVLVNRYRDLPFAGGDHSAARVPYDAQTWLRLERR